MQRWLDSGFCVWVEGYRRQEDLIIGTICARYWRPKRVGGSSIAKADLMIRTYFRCLLLCFAMLLLVIAGTLNIDLN
jgi:hypothetical protein